MFKTADQILEAFSIDPAAGGAADFSAICEIGALMLAYPEYGCSLTDVISEVRREAGYSWVVFYARIKRAIAPLLNASPDTLSAMGIELTGYPSSPAMAAAIAGYLARRIAFGDETRKAAMTAAAMIEGGKRHD